MSDNSSCCSFLTTPVVALNNYFSQNLPLHLQPHADEFTGMFLIVFTLALGAFFSYINRVLFTHHHEEHTTPTTPNHINHTIDHNEQPVLNRKTDSTPPRENHVIENYSNNTHESSSQTSDGKSPEKTPTRRGRSASRTPRRTAFESEISDIIGSRTSTRNIKPPSRFSPGGGVAFTELARTRRSPPRRNSLSRDEV
eukprot:TRINITY_DN7834_c0_g1_i1.p1 TRINITY_DN7834_c0_g1~~TRINITY_DN7834_c0_g1_i1.p1  ORF type:complete len:197 (+),score=32.60 TRINITY_DN7834_c0_g1_i1:290-880(+)